MGEILVADIAETYAMINDTVERINKSRDNLDNQSFFLARAVLPKGQNVYSMIEVWGAKYFASIGIMAREKKGFEHIEEKFKASLYKKDSLWEVYKVNGKTSHIIKRGSNDIAFLLELDSHEQGISLDLQCGTDGTGGKMLSKFEEFQDSLLDLTTLATLLYEPFLEKNGYPSEIIHYLNFKPGTPPQEPFSTKPDP